MYAVIKTGGKQYRVQVGDEIFVEKLSSIEGESVVFDEVLAVSDNSGLTVGTPYIKGMTVTGEVLKNGKSKKVTVFTYKPKKNEKRKLGHRQPYTKVVIKEIGAAKPKKKRAAAPKKAAEETAAPANDEV